MSILRKCNKKYCKFLWHCQFCHTQTISLSLSVVGTFKGGKNILYLYYLHYLCPIHISVCLTTTIMTTTSRLRSAKEFNEYVTFLSSLSYPYLLNEYIHDLNIFYMWRRFNIKKLNHRAKKSLTKRQQLRFYFIMRHT